MRIEVTTADGEQQSVETGSAESVMMALRDANVGIEGTCGGAMSCGTCHVIVDPAFADRLPPVSEDEADMLAALADVIALEPTSRLSCQLPVDPALDGLRVTVGPEL